MFTVIVLWFLIFSLLLIAEECRGSSGKVVRPQFGRQAGLPTGSADRRQQELHSNRLNDKIKQYPELFRPKRTLGPLMTNYPPTKADCGQTILHNRIVTTAVILTDELVAKYDVMTSEEKMGSTSASQRDPSFTSIERAMQQRLHLIHKRHENVRNIFAKLPLAYEEWPSVLAGACPISFMSRGPFSHRASERGLGMAHYMIWRDWFYRHRDTEISLMGDEDLHHSELGKDRTRNIVDVDPRCKWQVPQKYSTAKNARARSSEKNQQKEQQMIYNHDNDLLVVFEDDVDLADHLMWEEAGIALIRELDNLQPSKTDLHFLGWCYGKGLRAMPMCAHAYVITRRMAKVLMEHWEPCGLPVDAQWAALHNQKLIKWSRAHPESFNGSAEFSLLDEVNRHEKTAHRTYEEAEKSAPRQSLADAYFRGMFKQANMGSFNGHEWMPNSNNLPITFP
jgi:hypothetical protein